MKLNFNSFISISTCDYFGKASCVIFFNECNFRCKKCYNKQTWNSVNFVDIEKIKDMIKSSVPFISAVTFSGGEPFVQFEPLKELIEYSKSLGLSVAVETNGYFVDRIRDLKYTIDELYVDIKAPINNIEECRTNTGVIDSCKNLVETLNNRLPTEIRIVDNLDVLKIKESLEEYNFPIRILPFREM